jgi:hypothetical protein
MEALLSIVAAVVPGTLAGLSLTQWLKIATALAGAEPEIKAALAALHPAFAALVADLARGSPPDEAARNRLEKIPSEMSGIR